MYIYDEIFEESFYSARPFDFYYKNSDVPGEGKASIGVFDIETTGLDPRNGKVIMGALLTPVAGGLRVRQFFTEDESEEGELLEVYKSALDETDVLVSYNGNAFDFPYLRYRLKCNDQDASFQKVLSLDMFTVLRKYSNLREMIPNLKQKTVEEYMGLRSSRDDMIDGGESVRLFYRYLENPSDKIRDTMLLHNRDDVLQLSRILWVFDQLDIHMIACNTGFPVINEKDGDIEKAMIKMLVTDVNVKTKRLDIEGRYAGLTGCYRLFRDDCTAELAPFREKNLLEDESDYGTFKVSVPLYYEDKISGILSGDREPVIFRKDGETDFRAAAGFSRRLIKDILDTI